MIMAGFEWLTQNDGLTFMIHGVGSDLISLPFSLQQQY
jgi:hypothetical protein